MNVEFWVKLIKINGIQSKESQKSLNGNCTHVKGNYYIFEGDEWVLEEDGVKFKIIEEGAVGCLGGLTEKQLIKVCEESFGVDKGIFKK